MTISIITINYNHADGLERTIKSVISQTCKDYEYIVIDGGSTDGSKDVILKYQEHISYWVSEPDGGIYNAMNKGIIQANGDYCLFMNSGDCIYNDNVLKECVSKMTCADIVCGDLSLQTGIVCPNPESVTLRSLFKKTLYHQASFISTRLLKQSPYDETLRSAADWKWFYEQLIFQNRTYLHIPVIISMFEGGGISDSSNDVGRREVEETINSTLPPRVIVDMEDYCFGNSPYRLMVNHIENTPPLKKRFFVLNKFILKLINIKIKAKWINNL